MQFNENSVLGSLLTKKIKRWKSVFFYFWRFLLFGGCRKPKDLYFAALVYSVRGGVTI